MPRKQTKKQGKKKSYKVTPYRNPNAFGQPASVSRKLKISHTLQFSGTSAHHKFLLSANDAFDPLHSQGAGQASCFDQYAAMYNKYRVNGCKIKLRWNADSSTTSGAVMIVCSPNSTSTLPASLLDHSEQKGAKVMQMPAFGSGPQGQVLQLYQDCYKTMGVNKQTYKQASYGALVSTNPADLVYWIVSIGCPDTTTYPVGHLWITITQYVTFFEPTIVEDA